MPYDLATAYHLTSNEIFATLPFSVGCLPTRKCHSIYPNRAVSYWLYLPTQ